jgi:hypothetical protein
VFARIFRKPFRSILFDVLDSPEFPVHIVAWHPHIPMAGRCSRRRFNLLRLVVLRWLNARIINPQLFAQALRRCLVQFPLGLLAGVTVLVGLRRERSLSFRTQMLPRSFLANDLLGPIVFRVAVRHAVLVRNIKDGELAPLIAHGGDPLRLAVHDRVFAIDHSPDLAQHRGEFRPRIQCRRRLMFRFPFLDFYPVCFRSNVPSFFHRVPTCSERFRLVTFSVGNSQVRPLRVWNVFFHRPDLLGVSYLLLSFDRKDVLADALGIGRRVQMRRDRMTFAIIFGLPIVQILLFGFVINSDPRHLPIAALLADNGPEGRTLLQGLKNSTYFDFVRLVGTEQEGRSLLTCGEVQFVINIPQNFSHNLLRGDKPAILLEADATDPIAT